MPVRPFRRATRQGWPPAPGARPANGCFGTSSARPPRRPVGEQRTPATAHRLLGRPGLRWLLLCLSKACTFHIFEYLPQVRPRRVPVAPRAANTHAQWRSRLSYSTLLPRYGAPGADHSRDTLSPFHHDLTPSPSGIAG
jgi:hypothetical protein